MYDLKKLCEKSVEQNCQYVVVTWTLMGEEGAASIIASNSAKRTQQLLRMTAPSLNMNETGPVSAVRLYRVYEILCHTEKEKV